VSRRRIPNRAAIEELEVIDCGDHTEFMVYLKSGWTIDPLQSCRTFGADSVDEIADAMLGVMPWTGEEPD